MRQIAVLLLLTVVGLSAAELSGADLQALADKARTMKVGESGSVKVVLDGKPTHIGLVQGATGLTVAGEGIASARYAFRDVEQGLAVQSSQGGRTTTVLVKDGKISPAPAAVVGAFSADAAPSGTTEPGTIVLTAMTPEQSKALDEADAGGGEHQDLNSLTYQLSR